MCSRISLPQRHGAIIPHWDPQPEYRRRFTSASSECFNVDAVCTVYTTHHAGWSSLPGGCCSSVECFSAVCSFCVIAAAVPPRPEDVTVPVVVLLTIVSSCVTDCNFNIVRCPCNGPVRDWSATLNFTLTLHYITSAAVRGCCNIV